MEISSCNNLIKGWFIGDFERAILRTDCCEVAFKEYEKGFTEPAHHHKIATEVTYIIEGEAKFNDNVYKAGQIIKVFPEEVVKFETLTPVKTICVKIPGALNDKYEEEI